MADFDVVKISALPPTEIVVKDDLLVVDRLQAGQNYITNAVRIGKLVDFITASDLNFTGDVTLSGTIQPIPGGSLDGIFDNVTIRQSITISEGAEINGIYLDDLEDVKIDLPQVGDVIVYQLDPLTRQGIFLNKPFTGSGYVFDAPADSKYYARKDEAWVDIEEIGYIKDAPDDGNFYARQNGQWVNITSYLQIGEEFNLEYDL